MRVRVRVRDRDRVRVRDRVRDRVRVRDRDRVRVRSTRQTTHENWISFWFHAPALAPSWVQRITFLSCREEGRWVGG